MTNLLIYSTQVLAVVAVAAGAAAVFRCPSPRARLACWRGVLVVCLMLPVLPFRAIDRVTTIVALTDALPGVANAPRHAVMSSSLAWLVVLAPWLVVAGVAIRAAWLALGLVRLRRLRRESTPAALVDDVDLLRRAIAPETTFRSHPALEQPAAFGILRPIVLMPDRVATLPGDVQRAIACHELLHVRRGDWMWTLVEEALRSVFWFHPAFRWAISEVQLSREETVDAEAIAITGARRAYIGALMLFSNDAVVAAAAPFVRRRQLLLRIRSISRGAHMSPLRIAFNAAALAAIVVVSGWRVAGWLPLRAQTPASGTPSPATAQQTDPPRKVITRVNATYPAGMLTSNVAASVTLKVTVAPTGEVVRTSDPKWNVTIGSDSSVADTPSFWATKPQLAFIEAAEAAARQWKFDPADAEATYSLLFTFRTKKSGTDPAPAGGIAGGVSGGVSGGVAGGVQGGVTGGKATTPTSGAARPGEPVPVAAAKGPLHVGGVIRPPVKIVDVKPIYPEDARAAGIEGVVVLETTIADDGSVASVRVLRSIPMLDQAALDAVRQWKFQPTLMNGAPVEVVMTVTVNFTL